MVVAALHALPRRARVAAALAATFVAMAAASVGFAHVVSGERVLPHVPHCHPTSHPRVAMAAPASVDPRFARTQAFEQVALRSRLETIVVRFARPRPPAPAPRKPCTCIAPEPRPTPEELATSVPNYDPR